MRAPPLRMHDAFGDAFAVLVRELLDRVHAL